MSQAKLIRIDQDINDIINNINKIVNTITLCITLWMTKSHEFSRYFEWQYGVFYYEWQNAALP